VGKSELRKLSNQVALAALNVRDQGQAIRGLLGVKRTVHSSKKLEEATS